MPRAWTRGPKGHHRGTARRCHTRAPARGPTAALSPFSVVSSVTAVVSRRQLLVFVGRKQKGEVRMARVLGTSQRRLLLFPQESRHTVRLNLTVENGRTKIGLGGDAKSRPRPRLRFGRGGVRTRARRWAAFSARPQAALLLGCGLLSLLGRAARSHCRATKVRAREAALLGHGPRVPAGPK